MQAIYTHVYDRYVYIIFYYLAFILRLFLIRCFPLLLFLQTSPVIAQETFLSKGEFNFQQTTFLGTHNAIRETRMKKTSKYNFQ